MQQLRTQAVDEVYRSGGVDAVAQLAAGTEYRHFVGDALTRIDEGPDEHHAELAHSRRQIPFRGGVRLRTRPPLQRRCRVARSVAQRVVRRLGTSPHSTGPLDPAAAWTKLTELDPAVADRYWQESPTTGSATTFGSRAASGQVAHRCVPVRRPPCRPCGTGSVTCDSFAPNTPIARSRRRRCGSTYRRHFRRSRRERPVGPAQTVTTSGVFRRNRG